MAGYRGGTREGSTSQQPPPNVSFSRDSSFLMIHETQLSLSYIESPPLMILFLSPRLQPGFFSLLSQPETICSCPNWLPHTYIYVGVDWPWLEKVGAKPESNHPSPSPTTFLEHGATGLRFQSEPLNKNYRKSSAGDPRNTSYIGECIMGLFFHL